VLAGEQLGRNAAMQEKAEGSDYAEPSVEGSGRVDYRKPPSQ